MAKYQQIPGQTPAQKKPPFLLYFLITVVLIFSLTLAGIKLKEYIDKKHLLPEQETAVQQAGNDDLSIALPRIIYKLVEILVIIILVTFILLKFVNTKRK